MRIAVSVLGLATSFVATSLAWADDPGGVGPPPAETTSRPAGAPSGSPAGPSGAEGAPPAALQSAPTTSATAPVGASVPPAAGPRLAPSTTAPVVTRWKPTSVEGYREEIQNLEARAQEDSERGAQASAELGRIRHLLATETMLRSPTAMGCGVAAWSLAGAAFVGTGLYMTVNLDAFLFSDTSPPTALLAVTLAGLGTGLVGTILFVWGSRRVMKDEAEAPSAKVIVGPGTLGLSGTF